MNKETLAGERRIVAGPRPAMCVSGGIETVVQGSMGSLSNREAHELLRGVSFVAKCVQNQLSEGVIA